MNKPNQKVGLGQLECLSGRGEAEVPKHLSVDKTPLEVRRGIHVVVWVAVGSQQLEVHAEAKANLQLKSAG